MALLGQQWRRFIRWINPMVGRFKWTSPHGLLFEYAYRFSGIRPTYVSFRPNTTSLLNQQNIEVDVDLCDLDFPGHVLSIILDKPRIREDADIIVISYTVRVCYTNGGDEVCVRHHFPRDVFETLTHPPEWTVLCTDNTEYSLLDAWLVSMIGYRKLPLTETPKERWYD